MSNLPVLPASLDPMSGRAWLVEVNQLQRTMFAGGASIESLVHSRAEAVDQLLRALWQQAIGQEEALSLVAVGGYGRGELHPHSDVDLLVLTEDKLDQSASETISAFLTSLWDTGLEIGHSVRSIAQCKQQARNDVTVLTTLMETRCLAGSQLLYEQLTPSLDTKVFWQGADYLKAKYAEQRARHARYRDLGYALEPNIKGGVGGLRDIQTVLWVAKRHYQVDSLRELVDVDFLREGEFAALQEGQHFLWAVRFGLHQLAGRREDRLLFDYQRDLATQFGYVGAEQSNQAIEQFMQRYYRTVQRLQRLNEMLLQLMREDILGLGQERITLLNDELQLHGDFLGLVDPQAIERRPLLLLELFSQFQQRPFIKGLRASTIRAIGVSLFEVDRSVWSEAQARELFISFWRQRTRLPELLFLMHRYQLLGHYLPVFEKITGRMQFDLFHIYTVDHHTLTVVSEAHELLEPDLDAKQYPLATEVAPRLRKPELLLIACFFHDIAKGRGGDHSELGEVDAQQFCQAHGLTAADTELVSWLVRNHLLLSVTAQKKDIADPEVVNEFAAQVGNTRYLNYLYLLTIADIRGTNPKLWTRWKASLLAELYKLTRGALRRGLQSPLRRASLASKTRQDAANRLVRHVEEIDQVWNSLGDDYFVRHTPEQIVWHTEIFDGAERPVVGTRVNRDRHSLEMFIFADNIDGTFATIIATLDQLRLSVVDAKIFNTDDGQIVLDTFDVLPLDSDYEIDSDPQHVADKMREALLQRPLQTGLHDRPLSRRLRQFEIVPELNFSTTEDQRTLLELICLDQPGLLAKVALALLNHKVRIHNARIATFGERAEDYFWLTDQQDLPLSDEVTTQLSKTLVEALSKN